MGILVTPSIFKIQSLKPIQILNDNWSQTTLLNRGKINLKLKLREQVERGGNKFRFHWHTFHKISWNIYSTNSNLKLRLRLTGTGWEGRIKNFVFIYRLFIKSIEISTVQIKGRSDNSFRTFIYIIVQNVSRIGVYLQPNT